MNTTKSEHRKRVKLSEKYGNDGKKKLSFPQNAEKLLL